MPRPEWHSLRLHRWVAPIGSVIILTTIYAVLLSGNNFVELPGSAGLSWRSSWLGPSAVCVKSSNTDGADGFSAGVLQSSYTVDADGNSYVAGAVLDAIHDTVSLVMRKVSRPGLVVLQTALFEQPPAGSPASGAVFGRRIATQTAAAPAFPVNRALASLEQHACGVVSALQCGRLNSSLIVATNTSARVAVAEFSSLSLLSTLDGKCDWGSSFVNATSMFPAEQSLCASPAIPGMPPGLLVYAQALGPAETALVTGLPWASSERARRRLARNPQRLLRYSAASAPPAGVSRGRRREASSQVTTEYESCVSPLALLGRLIADNLTFAQLNVYALSFPCVGVSLGSHLQLQVS